MDILKAIILKANVKKAITMLALGLVLAFGLVACGSDGDTTPPAPTYSLSGYVDGVSDLAGFVVTATGSAGSGADTTDASGNYTITGLADGSYTVTPSKAGYGFTPLSLSVTISGADSTGNGFAAAGALGISGIINTTTGAALGSVTVDLSGDKTDSTLTAGGGTYSFTDLEPGSYTVTPSLWNHIFTADWSGTLTATDVTNADFTATAVWTISGAITNSGTGALLEGVAVDLTGDKTDSTLTVADGTYSFTGVPDGSYTVTPSKTDYAFNPVSTGVTVSGADATANFTGISTTTTWSISGKVTFDTGAGVVAFEGVTMTLSGDNTGTTATAADGTYTFAGLAGGGAFTVTPTMADYTFGAPWSGTFLTTDVTNADFTPTGPCSTISGWVRLASCCGSVEGALMTLDTTPALTDTVNINGYYYFGSACLPNGSYTLTPSLAGENAVFFPPQATVTSAASAPITENFTADVRYSVSGTVTYTGAKTGRVYISVERPGWVSPRAGTSIDYPAENTFIINGVQPGDNITLTAYMDHLGGGESNASNPAGSSAPITVTGDTTGVAITLTDPAPPSAVVPDWIFGSPASGAAGVFWDTPSDPNDNEIAESYNLYWSTSASVNSSAYDGTVSVPVAGDPGLYIHGGLTDGQNLYYIVYVVTGGAEITNSPVSGPVTIGATTGDWTVSGAVAFPATAGGVSTLGKPMLVGLFKETAAGPPEVYLTSVTTSSTTQAYSVSGVPAETYYHIAIIDMNANGIIDLGDINTGDDSGLITITGNTTGADLTLTAADALAVIFTGHTTDGTNHGYSLEMEVKDGLKLPVKVRVTGPNIPGPIDMGKDDWGGHGLWVDLRSEALTVGDTYTFDVTYSDGSTGTLTGSVSTVLDSFATPTYPVNPTHTGNNDTTPTFTWTAPASPPASYTYSINIYWGEGVEIWHLGDIPSSQLSVEFNYDGEASQDPLTGGTTYYWSITVHDADGNSASYETTFTP